MSNDPSTSSIPEDTTTNPDQDTVSFTTTATNTTTTTTATTVASASTSSSDSFSKFQAAIHSLSTILPSLSLPPSFSSARQLLHDPHITSNISTLLRHPDSGAGDNNLCRWLYDTLQSSDPDLQLLVLRFVPIIAGLYLSRVRLRVPLAGFEAVLLALYAHETASRAGNSITVNVPDLSHPSLYHESKAPIKNNSTGLNLAVISPSLEPHGTVRSTRRARIVGVALELYYSKIFEMPVDSKIDFCEFCRVWAGQDGHMYKDMNEIEISASKDDDNKTGGDDQAMNKESSLGRIPLPWELLQPVLRILGHCLLWPNKNKELSEKASVACRSLYSRSMHDINPKAILATESLLKLRKVTLMEAKDGFDPTEVSKTKVISL